jgi:hypothetical protein
MERNLSVGGVFATAFSVFRSRMRVLVPIGLVSTLLVSAISALLGEGAIGVIVGFIVDMAYFAFVTAVAMVVLRDLREERPASSARELLARALPLLPTVTLATTLVFVAVCGAAVLLVVPGLYLATIWAVLLPVVVVERPDLSDAFGRSRQLVRRDGWKVLGILLLLGLILVGTSLPFVFLVEGEMAHRLIGALISSFTTPFAALVLGALYYRLLDIEQAGLVLQQPGDGAG